MTTAVETTEEKAVWFARNAELKRERMLRELMSDLHLAVEAGEMTDAEANEWYNYKADQWANGVS